jgi:hypothetical protein
MPLLKLETTVALADDKKQALLASLSKIVAGTIGKPEQYVMVVISPAAILMSGKPGPAAFVDIKLNSARVLNLNSLNPQQRQAVETLNGPVLILAGAGTGKTRVITFRIAHLIAKGVAPGNILAVTFTNKAAREMQERVRKLLPKPEGRKESKARDTRPRHSSHHLHLPFALRPDFAPAHRTARLQTEFCHLRRIGTARRRQKNPRADFREGRKSRPGGGPGLLSRFKNGGERAAVFADESVRALAQHIRSRYESALHACNAVDFDDLILLTLRLFREHPDVLEACRAKYRYVMVDEYQDTNATQFQLVHALTLKHRNFCVVGDDDQSIYGWRGAEIANLLDLEKHFPEVKIIKLEQNYRSTNTILDAANAIIKNNARRRPKQLWSGKGRGERSVLRAYTNDDDEARNLVEQIEFAAARTGFPGCTTRDFVPHEPAVASARNRVPHGRRALSSHRRPELFRPARNPRFSRLPEGVHQPARRRQPAAHRQRAGARVERRDHGTPARREPGAEGFRVRRDEKSGGAGDLSGQGAPKHRGVC